MNCYICNKKLKQKGSVLDKEKETETHEEHIIQNALRGKLSSSNILCTECGNMLNDTIDSEFVRFFAPITEQLNEFLINKDHGKNNASVAVLGQLLLSEFPDMDVSYKEGVITSHKPIHHIDWQNKKATILANKKVISDYERKVIKEITDKGENVNDFEVKKITNITDGVFLPYFGKGIIDVNETMSKGFIKIAVEFALSAGLTREDLNRALKFNGDGTTEILFDRNVITYFPQGAIDKVYEYYKPLLEPNYPTHTLILFTHERRSGRHTLYCYIELFSTFQVYVILNHSFEDSCYHSYYQPVLKDEILSDKETKNLTDTLRDIHKRFEKIYAQEDPLDEIESNISEGLQSLPDDLKQTLESEIEGIDNIIMNQNMDKRDFEDMSTYDLTVGYKKYFYNHLSEDCESMPGFLIKASIYADESIVNYVEKYNSEKMARLLPAIMILQDVAADDNTKTS